MESAVSSPLASDRPLAIPEYPFTPQRWMHRGQQLSYVEAGDGPPVVMLHGNPTWSYYYRRLIIALQDRYRCLALDHVGCGLSSKPSPQEYDYSLARRIEDLDAWLAAVVPGHQPITLVVHDWGGMIGLAWAVQQPQRLAALIVMNSAAFPKPVGKPLPWMLWLARNTRVGAWLIRRHNLFCRLALRWCVSRPLPADVRAAYLYPYDQPEHRWAVLRFVQTIPLAPGDAGYDLVTRTAAGLERLRHLPALLVWGLRDFVFDADYLAEWRRRLPQAEVLAYPDAGHYVLEDAETAIPRIRAFLDSVQERSPNVEPV